MVLRGAVTTELDPGLLKPHEVKGNTRILVIVAPYYADVANALLKGARGTLNEASASYECVTVAGALEIPQALSQAVAAGLIPRKSGGDGFDGVVAIGCVIRGETSHYDIVCNSSNHWLMETATRHAIPVGNAILTVDTHAQAMVRADGSRESKGAGAARACLGVIAIGREFAKRKSSTRS